MNKYVNEKYIVKRRRPRLSDRVHSFHCYIDPGHGWLKAPRVYLDLLGIANQISDYSYQRKGNVYLEEDCDATLFLRTLKEHGIEYKLIHHYGDKRSKIRSYANYCCAA